MEQIYLLNRDRYHEADDSLEWSLGLDHLAEFLRVLAEELGLAGEQAQQRVHLRARR